jgi:hypothetical protein
VTDRTLAVSKKFTAATLRKCLGGLAETLTLLTDERREHRTWTQWRVLTFKENKTGDTYSVEYTVLENDRGIWRPFGHPMTRVECTRITRGTEHAKA